MSQLMLIFIYVSLVLYTSVIALDHQALNKTRFRETNKKNNIASCPTVLYGHHRLCIDVDAHGESPNIAAVHVIVELQTIVLVNRQVSNLNSTAISLLAIFTDVRKLTYICTTINLTVHKMATKYLLPTHHKHPLPPPPLSKISPKIFLNYDG